MKIAILLPSKEDYTQQGIGAVNILVKTHLIKSKFREDIKIYGHNVDKPLNPKNFVAVKKNKYLFKNRSYIKSFSKIIDNKTDLIEIHNRPSYYIYLHKKFPNKKFILYFHNDPNALDGSRSVKDKEYIINNCDKIIFLSKWIKNKFVKGLKINNSSKFFIFYPGVKSLTKFPKKKNLVIFVGKLNKDKGYDIYLNGVEKFIKKFPKWKSFSIGFEKRRDILPNEFTKELGQISNDKVLNIYKNASIAVANSVRDEPLGRLPIEAASRGCIPIISNKGGLPETISDSVILKMNNSHQLFLELSKIAKNKNQRKRIQKKIFNEFNYDINEQIKKIDNIRNIFLNKIDFSRLKIIHVCNLNHRFTGRLQYNTSNRLNNGFIRLGHNVLNISDRDFLHYNKSLFDIDGSKKLNKYLIDTHKNFKADLIVFGHADSIYQDTIAELRRISNVKICQWFLDPVTRGGPDYLKNVSRIKKIDNLIDCTFLTTSPDVLNFKLQNPYFMPNPSDHSFEKHQAYKKNNLFDIFFAMSHGVHRGRLKQGKFDNREIFLKELVKMCSDVNFDLYGFNNIQPIWGEEFLVNLTNSSMALNLSRGDPVKYYSSDRIAQLMGNGLLTFIDKKTQYSDFFNKNELVTYSNIEDLAEKIKFYKKNEKIRKEIARQGQKKYNKFFNSTIVSDYIIKKTFKRKSKKKFFFEL